MGTEEELRTLQRPARPVADSRSQSMTLPLAGCMAELHRPHELQCAIRGRDSPTENELCRLQGAPTAVPSLLCGRAPPAAGSAPSIASESRR